MKGWLVTNGFLKSDKFNTLYSFFQNSAKKLNIDLRLIPTDALICESTDNFHNFPRPEFVIFWDKDVMLAHRLERAGFKLFNCAHAVEVCDSKSLTAFTLAGVVPMPKTVHCPKTFPAVGYTDLGFVRRAVEILGLPLVVKESYGSFGEQVYLANTVEETELLANKLAGKDFVFQQFIAESAGRDIRVNVVGGKVVNAVLRQSANGDFRSNVTLGGTMTPYELSTEERTLAETVCQNLGLDFAGVDILQSNNAPLLCEVNSNPQFKSTFDCTGVDLSLIILQHVANKISKCSNRKN